ncbi:MAG: DNA alkylation repair protein [Bacteroidetes bacterium]|nr:DNA alkylation repair protein [Bacteroidota bacterium]
MVLAESIIRKLEAQANPEKAKQLERFFKTEPGQYGEGDRFLGIPIPEQRKIARLCFRECPLDQLGKLLESKVHDHRMTALLMLVAGAESRAGRLDPKPYVDFYLTHLDWINNWDLVDVTCPKILGPWFYGRDRKKLVELATSDSNNLWHQRIAIITTYYFIRQKDYSTTFEISDILFDHPHDLIHKAVGWMLREVGNRDPQAERDYLDSRYKRMPRTMLRYAIEKFPEEERQAYLHGDV